MHNISTVRNQLTVAALIIQSRWLNRYVRNCSAMGGGGGLRSEVIQKKKEGSLLSVFIESQVDHSGRSRSRSTNDNTHVLLSRSLPKSSTRRSATRVSRPDKPSPRQPFRDFRRLVNSRFYSPRRSRSISPVAYKSLARLTLQPVKSRC